MSSDKDSNTALLLAEVRGISANLTSLTHTVARVDQRLVDVEKHTALIPTMMSAIGATSSDIDDHERQLKNHDKRIVGLEQAA